MVAVALVVAVAVAALLLGACSDDGGAPGTTESSPFRAEGPTGYELVSASRGEREPTWGDEGETNHGPWVVLAPRADVEDPSAVTTVAAHGHAAVGLDGLSAGNARPGAPVDVDGHEAIHRQVEEDLRGGPFTELVVARTDDLALVVRSPDLEQGQLVDLVGRTTTADRPSQYRLEAPEVDPPSGLVEIGAATTDLALALDHLGAVPPGPPRAHVAFWRGPSRDGLAVMTLPTTAGDVAAALGYPRVRAGTVVDRARFELDGRDAVHFALDLGADGRATTTYLVTTTAWGDLLVLESEGDAPLSRDDLIEVAESIERIDADAWAELVP